MGYLCYDVVRLILKIKYENWCKLKMCICGGDNFKVCWTFKCQECNEVYCNKQKGVNDWIWYCTICEGRYCGMHEFKLDRLERKTCFFCISRSTYGMYEGHKIMSLKPFKAGLLETYEDIKNEEWRKANMEEVEALLDYD